MKDRLRLISLQIGELLGIPHQTVISRLNSAHKKLRIDLKGGT